ncbi:hypothetical protein [Flavobacterium piscis]|uniref:Tox-MPTase3 domain-containing protein n=1 Tax=Flavobacterium piscis TaxID=1114874 RepID=A0ABU1YC93_9FLAO|nr:hypothetical protein [Flavobacterium piscis]MDR7211868.1 hypothetical protein [Flavobacterium piscis]
MRNKYFILVLTFFGILASQESFGQDFNGSEWDDVVYVDNDYHAPDYPDIPVFYDEPNYTDYYNDPYDDYFNNDNPSNPSENSSSTETPQGPNIIDKPVITKSELSKLIQDLIKRYEVSTKDKYVLTTAKGESHTGTIIKFEDRSTGHSFYYFTPDKTSGILQVGNYYKIPEPTTNGSTNTSTNVNITITGYIGSDGMPVGFQTMGTSSGSQPIFLGANDEYPEPYCQDCTRIDPVRDPKYPALLKLLPKIRELVMNNSKIKMSFANASGYSLQSVDHLLSVAAFEKHIRVANISTWGLFEGDITPNIVFIRENLVASLETGGFKLGGENEDLNGTSFFTAIVILHELVHYCRKSYNLPADITINGVQYEAGEVFETAIFGRVLGITGVTNIAKQYGWTF